MFFKHSQEFFESRLYEEGLIGESEEDPEDHRPAVLEKGQFVHVVIGMPFLDMQPLGATE